MIVDEGWVKLHRKMLNNPIFKDSEALHLFIYLLLRANHKPNRFLFNQREMTIGRGQLITGIDQIFKDTKISRWQIRSRLDILGKLGILTRKTTNKFSIITICNYTHYQDSKNERPQAKPQSNHNQTAANKNDKKKKIYVEGSEELRLASLLLGEIQKNNPNFRKPDIQSWSKQINLMIQRDWRDIDHIARVICWCQKHHFWWKNVLSTSGLRRHFDRLEAEMQSDKKDSSKRAEKVYRDLGSPVLELPAPGVGDE